MASFYKKPPFILISILIIAALAVFLTIRLSDSSRSLGNSLSYAKGVLPVPTLLPIGNTTTVTDVHSPDGTMKLIMKKANKGGGQMTYTFSVSDISGANQKTIFVKTAGSGQTMFLPANSWSPDDKYFFLEELDGGAPSFFVFKVSGEPFDKGEEYIDVVPIFNAKKTGYTLSDITGWDGDMLLHVHTNSDKGRGPSFWFEIPSRNFIQLASS